MNIYSVLIAALVGIIVFGSFIGARYIENKYVSNGLKVGSVIVAFIIMAELPYAIGLNHQGAQNTTIYTGYVLIGGLIWFRIFRKKSKNDQHM